MADTGYAAMVAAAHEVIDGPGPPPACPSCGAMLKLALYPAVRWVCGGCVRWAWVEPPDDALVRPETAAEAGA